MDKICKPNCYRLSIRCKSANSENLVKTIYTDSECVCNVGSTMSIVELVFNYNDNVKSLYHAVEAQQSSM